MQEVYQSEFVKHIYHPEEQVLEAIWTEGGKMVEEAYRQESLHFLETSKKYKAEGNLIDTRDFQYIISPEVQDWLNTTVFPELMETGVQKMAFLVTKELFAQVSIEQAMDDNKEKGGFQSQFFDDRAIAWHWLND